MITLQGQRVLITGASAGIGQACAVAFAKLGCHVLLAARRVDRIDAIAKQLQNEYGIETKTIGLDVCDAVLVERTLSDLPPPWNDIDVLVNNAGLARGLEPFYQGNPSDWDVMIDTNVKGLLYVSRFVVPGMIERQRGHVINVGSIAGYQAYANGTVYCASKFAVRAITEGMKQDLHGSGVRVTEIAPGIVETEFSNVRFKGDQSRVDAVYQGMQPLTADDIANTITYCASLPPHMDIMTMAVWPTDQSSAALVHRNK